jgi:exopolyphosphatase/guanosine-5'-triphosphate,3'-diphosphate pyrophosphatase
VLPGFSHREIALMALLAQHHRRGSPDVTPFKGLLTHQDTERAEKLSALLRLAKYLDRSRTQAVHSLTCRVLPQAVQLNCQTHGDASTEVWSTQRHADLFKQAFKRDVVIQTRPIKAERAAARHTPIGG